MAISMKNYGTIEFTIGFADTDFHLSKSLILWINDGLMAIFFFVNYKQLLGVSLLGGLGFIRSLFIVNLAYTSESFIAASKMGVIIGSLIAGILGYVILRFSLKPKK